MQSKKQLEQLAAAEGHHDSKGYELGNQQDYEAAVAQRNQSSGSPSLTYEEVLHELWYLRRRVRQLETQLDNSAKIREQFERECE
jgi:predicted nucleic acid-binding protein